MPFSILIYCDDSGGGAAVATHRLALGLVERGYAVSWLQSPAKTSQDAERRAAGVQCVDLPYDTVRYFAAVMNETRTPARLFGELRPDLILFADSLMESTLGAKEAAALLRIPYLIVKHLVVPDGLYAREPALKARLGATLGAAGAVVTVSEASRRVLGGHYPELGDRLTAISNSVPDVFFTPPDPARRAEWRRRHGIPDGALAVLTIAAVNHRKGFHYQAYLIKALKEAGRLAPYVFVWAGEPDHEFFRSLWTDLEAAECDDHVRALGYQSDPAGLLDGCDAFLLPSEHEGMPLVVLEAMAKGCPVVATDVGGTSEALGDAGVLVSNPLADPNRTIRDIAATLDRWQADPDERRRVGGAGRRRAQSFRTGVMLDRYEAEIRRAAFESGSWVSPNLPLVRPDWALPFIVVDGSGPHPRFHDTRFPRLPSHTLTRDEAHLVHVLARQFAGGRALEAGCSMGWTALHLVAAGLGVDFVDPIYLHPEICRLVMECLPSEPPPRFIRGPAGTLLEKAREINGGGWSLIVADSQRELLQSEPEAVDWERFALPDAMVILPGVAKPGPASALARLAAVGWNTRVYRTAGRLGIAWRGAAVPVDHIPDPRLPEFPE